MTHGRADEAEPDRRRHRGQGDRRGSDADATCRRRRRSRWSRRRRCRWASCSTIFIHKYPKRTVLGFTMMVTQSFLYNAIFFTYALVLENFYGIAKDQTGYYFFPFAIGNLLGPLLLGPPVRHRRPPEDDLRRRTASPAWCSPCRPACSTPASLNADDPGRSSGACRSSSPPPGPPRPT